MHINHSHVLILKIIFTEITPLLCLTYFIYFIVRLAWVFYAPGFDSTLALISSLSAFIAAFFVLKRSDKSERQVQNISAGGIGIQAGRDVLVSKTTMTAKGKTDA